MTADSERTADILKANEIYDFKIIDVKETVVVEDWVRLHCMFGCPSYGSCGTCPPAVPPVAECRTIIMSYDKAVIIRFAIPYKNGAQYAEDVKEHEKRLFAAERELFREGYYKVMLLTLESCHLCEKCICGSDRTKCVNPYNARPSVDAMGISVFDTAANAGYDIKVLREFGEMTNRFAMILLD